MADNVLESRRIALEESFFRKENERLRERMRIAREREAARQALASELGLRDEALLDRLLDLGIRIDTVAFHLGNIYRKLHVRTRSEAILKYMGRAAES